MFTGDVASLMAFYRSDDQPDKKYDRKYNYLCCMITIGNIISVNGKEQTVESIDRDFINGHNRSDASISFVKMDESKLDYFGFEFDEQYDRWSHEKLVGYDVYVHGRTFSFGVDLEDMFHFCFHTDEVHTFQNAFNLLAGNQYI